MVQQKTAVARPTGGIVPGPWLLQEHFLVANAGGDFRINCIAEITARIRDLPAIRRPHGGRIVALEERETRALAACKIEHPQIAGRIIEGIANDSTRSIRR